MARIRTIKPEFWVDEKLAKLDPTTRLVFLGLISQADDAGRLVDNVKLLDGLLFPVTQDTCRDSLDTLESLGRIIRYSSESGQGLIQLANWEKHQNVQKPSKYVLPAFTPETLPNPSGDPPESPRRLPVSDLGSWTVDHGPRTADHARGKPNGHSGAPTDQQADGDQATCVLFVRDQGYGPTEKLIAEGEDATAWNTPGGDRVPWSDRLRLLKLADAHLRAPNSKARDLRGALTFVILRQYDPLKHRTADEIQSIPKPGTEAALVRSETPGRERNGGSSGGLTLVGTPKEPPKPVVDLEGERVRRWAEEHPEKAERFRDAIALRIQRGEGPRSDSAKKAWAEAELRVALLNAIESEEHAA